jgi:hypothetical protein
MKKLIAILALGLATFAFGGAALAQTTAAPRLKLLRRLLHPAASALTRPPRLLLPPHPRLPPHRPPCPTRAT